MRKHFPLFLIIIVISIVISLVVGVMIYVRKPRYILQNALKKQVNEYEVNYEIIFKPKPAGTSEIKTLDVFYLNGKMKTIKKFFKDDVIQGKSIRVIRDDSTQLYFETPNGSFSCFTPVFIDENGGVTPTGPLTCQLQSVAKDPLSTDDSVIPAVRLNLISNYLNNDNLSYLGEKEIINRQCRLFDADIKMLESSISENLKYHREVYKTEPSEAKITFCLDKQSAIPLEMFIELSTYTPNYGNMNTELSYKATILNLNVDEREFILPAPVK